MKVLRSCIFALCAALAVSFAVTPPAPYEPPRSAAAPFEAPRQIAAASYRLYLSSGTRLYPFDSATLDNLRGAPAIQIGKNLSRPPVIVASPDGSLLAVISHTRSNVWPPRAQDVTIHVLDARTGALRARFHPAVPLWLAEGISADGSQIYGFSRDENMGPTSEWDVISGTDGRLLHRLRFSESCCDPALYDPARGRLYTIDTGYFNSLGVQSGPQTPVLVAYDIASGRRVGRFHLPGLLAGSWLMSRQAGGSPGGYPIVASWTPGFALSPDGREIAVLDAQRNVLRLIDSGRLAVKRTEDLGGHQSALKRLGEWLGLIPTLASAKEFEGTSLEMSFSPDGNHLYVTGTKGHIDNRGNFTGHGLGIRAIDVARGTITGSALAGDTLWWTGPSPDGRAVYTIAPTQHGNRVVYPFTLRRHDPVTLRVRTTRRFAHRPDLLPWIWFLAGP